MVELLLFPKLLHIIKETKLTQDYSRQNVLSEKILVTLVDNSFQTAVTTLLGIFTSTGMVKLAN